LRFLLDTNILSELQRSEGHPAIRSFISSVDEQDLFISVITLGELAFGISRLHPSRRRSELEQWFDRARSEFSERILSIDYEIARIWGDITAQAARTGHTLHVADGLIAATAINHHLTVVTRNAGDFRTVTEVIDPCVK
jgi:toxin FitB